MTRIAVCDDLSDVVNQLNEYLSEYQELKDCELNDYTTKIVYISAKDCYDRQLFDVQPLNFLPKPVDKQKLFKMVDLTIQLTKYNERFFVFENKQGSFRIEFDNILYFESCDHYLKIVTKARCYDFKSTISEAMKQLQNSRFIQTHRSYIINYDNTTHIKYEEIKMPNGDSIPISRDRRKDVRNIISKMGRGKLMNDYTLYTLTYLLSQALGVYAVYKLIGASFNERIATKKTEITAYVGYYVLAYSLQC